MTQTTEVSQQAAVPAAYGVVARLNLKANEVTYRFTHTMLGRIRDLLRGNFSEGHMVKQMLKRLHENEEAYETFLTSLVNGLAQSHKALGRRSLPLGHLADMGPKGWREFEDADVIDRLRKGFSASASKLKLTLERKPGYSFREDHLHHALLGFADFHTLLTKLIEDAQFLQAISGKSGANVKAQYAEQLVELQQQFLDGLAELERAAQLDKKNPEGESVEMNENFVKVLTATDALNILFDVLPWSLINNLEVEDLEEELTQCILLASSAPQKLALQWQTEIDGEVKTDNGGVMFFKVVTGEYYMLSMKSEQEWPGELQVECFESEREFLAGFTELLNDWEPDFEAIHIESERNFMTSTKEDVEHAIRMLMLH